MKPYEHLNGKVVFVDWENKFGIVNIDYDIGISIIDKEDPENCLLSVDGPYSPWAKKLPKNTFEKSYSDYENEFEEMLILLEKDILYENEFDNIFGEPGSDPVCYFS